jgi:hypothetical protein
MNLAKNNLLEIKRTQKSKFGHFKSLNIVTITCQRFYNPIKGNLKLFKPMDEGYWKYTPKYQLGTLFKNIDRLSAFEVPDMAPVSLSFCLLNRMYYFIYNLIYRKNKVNKILNYNLLSNPNSNQYAPKSLKNFRSFLLLQQSPKTIT